MLEAKLVFHAKGHTHIQVPHWWTKSCTTLKPWENHCLLVFTREASFQGVLGGAGFRPSTVWPRAVQSVKGSRSSCGLPTRLRSFSLTQCLFRATLFANWPFPRTPREPGCTSRMLRVFGPQARETGGFRGGHFCGVRVPGPAPNVSDGLLAPKA